MNYKKILSTALTVIMVFSMVAVFLPARAEAAYSSSTVAEGTLSSEEVVDLVNSMYENNYSSAGEMLKAEKKEYLYSITSEGDAYTLYVNKYTGVSYYKNNVTGEILVSNPFNIASGSQSTATDARKRLMSQIYIEFAPISSPQSTIPLYSADAALDSQISVSLISNGLRVNYTLGDTTTRYMAPGQITDEAFVEKLMQPLFETVFDAMVRYCFEEAPENLPPNIDEDAADILEELYSSMNYFDSDSYKDSYGAFDKMKARKYLQELQTVVKIFYPTNTELTTGKYPDLFGTGIPKKYTKQEIAASG